MRRAGLSYRGKLRLSTTSQSHFVRQGRVAAPSVCCAAARILLAAAPTAPPCFRRWRRSSPLPLVGEPLAKPFTLRGLPRPLPLGEVARHRRDGEGKPVSREPPRSDRQALCRSDTIAVQSCLAAALPSQSGLRPPAPPKGEPLAGRATSYCLPEARIWRKRAGLATEGSSF